jgi:hypothetical protein
MNPLTEESVDADWEVEAVLVWHDEDARAAFHRGLPSSAPAATVAAIRTLAAE